MIERIEEKESDGDDVGAVIDVVVAAAAVGLRKLNGVRWRQHLVSAAKGAMYEAE